MPPSLLRRIQQPHATWEAEQLFYAQWFSLQLHHNFASREVGTLRASKESLLQGAATATRFDGPLRRWGVR